MSTTSLTPSARLARQLPESPLRIAVVYSDQAAANKMTEVYNRLVHQLREITQAEGVWWSMDLLARDDVFARSLQTASVADLLFVAASARGTLPEKVCAWLTAAMLDSPQTDRCLAALIGTDGGQDCWHSSVDDFLQNLARRAGAEYYALWHHVRPVQGLAPGQNLQSDIDSGSTTFESKFYGIDPATAGGINE